MRRCLYSIYCMKIHAALAPNLFYVMYLSELGYNEAIIEVFLHHPALSFKATKPLSHPSYNAQLYKYFDKPSSSQRFGGTPVEKMFISSTIIPVSSSSASSEDRHCLAWRPCLQLFSNGAARPSPAPMNHLVLHRVSGPWWH